jgi:uncharacterized membrane protein YhhN
VAISPFLILACLLALADWLAVWRKWVRVSWITKPAVMLALAASLFQVGGLSGYLIFFAIALFFSMMGDIALLLPPSFFSRGLLAFFGAHLAYTAGLNPSIPPLRIENLLLVIAVASASFVILRHVLRGLARGPISRRLKPEVIAYTIAISAMLISALVTLSRPDWAPRDSVLIACGGMFFYISDAVLSLNRFASPISNARLWVRISYHIGQVLLVCGALLHYAGRLD